MKTFKMITFAWDSLSYESAVMRGINILQEAGFSDNDLRSKVMFYVYVDSDAEYENVIYRCKKLREMNVNSFVMYNVDKKRPQRIIDLQRWANRKKLYWKCDIGEYNQQARILEPC